MYFLVKNILDKIEWLASNVYFRDSLKGSNLKRQCPKRRKLTLSCSKWHLNIICLIFSAYSHLGVQNQSFKIRKVLKKKLILESREHVKLNINNKFGQVQNKFIILQWIRVLWQKLRKSLFQPFFHWFIHLKL